MTLAQKKLCKQYETNRMSPFDTLALRSILDTFGRKNLRCLEIGSWFGTGSTQIIGEYSDCLVCVDHWQGNDNAAHREILKNFDVYQNFCSNTANLSDVIVPIRGDSSIVCPLLASKSFDFIFIDGDHKYLPTIVDIKNCRKLVKEGGILAGHDCEGRMTEMNKNVIYSSSEKDHIPSVFSNFVDCHPGVIRAVNEEIENAILFAERDLVIEGVKGSSTIWCVEIV